MTWKLASAALLLPLAACAPASEETAQEGIGTPELPAAPAPAPGTASPSPATPAAGNTPANALPASELPGEYRVAGVDGGDIDLPHGIAASIRDGRILVTADCVRSAWHYTYADGRLRTTSDPVIACDRGRHPAEAAVIAAFDSAERAVRTPSNGIEISGGGRSVTLFSQ